MSAFADHFHWLRPLWLLALLPALLLLLSLLRSHFQNVQWHKHIAPELLPTLLDGHIGSSSRWLLAAIGAGWLAACIVLAGPVWQKQPTPVVQNTQALVIAWDLSPSMLAQDISPSRLERSRLKIIDLLNARTDGQTALIAYSGEAYTVTPLTDDIQTIINLLPALGPTTLPSVGSNPEMAFSQANELLNQAGIARGQILLLTDEIPADALDTLRDEMSSSPHQLTLWGIGNKDGAPIPLPQGGFAKDGSGNMVLVKLNETELRQFATETRSYYVPMVTDPSDIDALEQLLSSTPSQDESAASEQLFDQWIEHGHWLLWACLPLLALGFRRGWLMVLVVMAPIHLFTPNADASPFQTNDQAGFKAYQKEDYETAISTFEDPTWRGSALYRAGDYEAAAEAFAKDPSATGDFNRGNAHLLSNNLDGAIQAFEDTLKKQPEHAGAQKNLALAQALKEQQDQQEQDQDQQNQEQQDGEQSEDSESEDSQQDQEQQDSQQHSQEQQDGQQGQSSSSDNEQNQQDGSEQENSEGQSSSADATQAQQASSGAGSSSSADTQIGEQIGEQEPQTEEEQMLEQALRKVPDDPAGLMRNKFNYQYQQRQQEIRRGNHDQSRRAEQRW